MPLKMSAFLIVALLSMGMYFSANAECPGCICNLSSTPLNFGQNYSPLSRNPVEVMGKIIASCHSQTPIVNATLTLILNAGAKDSFPSRILEGGGNGLRYNIYIDGSHTQVLGDGTQGTATSTAACSSTENMAPYSCSHTFIIFAQIPGGQITVPGNTFFASTLTATLSY
jgi:spore coat protein U-like protein